MVIRKALILTYDKFQDNEVLYPYYRLQEAGFKVDVSAEKIGPIFGINGCKMMATVEADKINPDDYDFLCIPGGVKALEKLRQVSEAIEFTRKFHDDGKIIASICHGAQILISAGVCKGKKISGYYSIKDDIINAGGTYIDEAWARDGNVISSPHYDFMPEWLAIALKMYDTWSLVNNDRS